MRGRRPSKPMPMRRPSLNEGWKSRCLDRRRARTRRLSLGGGGAQGGRCGYTSSLRGDPRWTVSGRSQACDLVVRSAQPRVAKSAASRHQRRWSRRLELVGVVAVGRERGEACLAAHLVGEMPPGGVGALGDRRRGAVERDGHDHDRDPREERQGRVRVEPVGPRAGRTTAIRGSPVCVLLRRGCHPASGWPSWCSTSVSTTRLCSFRATVRGRGVYIPKSQDGRSCDADLAHDLDHSWRRFRPLAQHLGLLSLAGRHHQPQLLEARLGGGAG
jgi:hypothetical protein